jgi:hypothetical protein
MLRQTPLEKYKHGQRKKFQAYVERHMDDSNLCWIWVSRVPLLDFAFIRKWRHKPWNWFYLSLNKCFSHHQRVQTRDEFNWTFFNFDSMEEYMLLKNNSSIFSFCQSDKAIVTDVEKYRDFEWNWYAICLNRNITEDFVVEYKSKLYDHLDVLSSNPALSIDFFKKTMDEFHWNTTHIAANPNVNDKNFSVFFDKRSFKVESRRCNLSENEGISLDFILKNQQFDWNVELVNYRSDITKEHILRYPDFCWYWDIISCCESIDKKFLKTNDKTNTFEFYHYNNALTIDEVEHLSPEKIQNNLLLGTVTDKMEFLRKFNAVRIIENAFFNCYWFVDYAYCRKRLNKRYDELFNIHHIEEMKPEKNN